MSSAPRSPLMPLDEALSTLLQQITPLAGSELVATFDADGRVLAEDVVSSLQVPAFDNSSMDGYAVRCADLLPGGELSGAIFEAAKLLARGEPVGGADSQAHLVTTLEASDPNHVELIEI